MASDRQWYPPELHPDVIGRWWESAPVATAVAVLDRPAIATRMIPVAAAPALAVLDTFDALDAPSARAFEEIVARFDEPRPDRPRADTLIPEYAWETIDLRLPYPHRGREDITLPEPDLRPWPTPARSVPLPSPPSKSRLRRFLGRAPVATGALAAVGAAAVGIGGLHAYARLRGEPDAPSSAPTIGLVSVFDLRTGMCLSDISAAPSSLDELVAVDCTAEHTHRVAATVAVGATLLEFDAEEVRRQGSEGCANELAAQGLVNQQFLMLQPSPESWADGDRQVVCLAAETGTSAS